MNGIENSNTLWFPKNFKTFHIIFILSYFATIYFFIFHTSDSVKNKLLKFEESKDVIRQLELGADQKNLITLGFENLEQNILIETFMIEMSSKEYKGIWKHGESTSNIENYKKENFTNEAEEINLLGDFKNQEGEIIFRIRTSRSEMNMDIKHLQFDIDIKDGKYKEKWVNLKQDFILMTSISNILLKNDLEFKFNYTSDPVYTKITSKENKKLDSTFVKYELYKDSTIKMAHVNFLELFFMNRTLNHIEGKFRFDEMGIDLEFKGTQKNEYLFDRKVSNFALILALVGIMHIYNSLLIIKEIILGIVNPKSFSTLFVSSNLIWNAIISIGCFYIAMTYPNYFTDFALPSIIYFIDFSVFQIRFMFIVWRFQNLDIDLSREEGVDLRRKIFRFYLLLYTCLFVSLVSIYFILIYKWLLLLIATFVFLPQIYHNTVVNITRNKIPQKTILVVVLNRFFFPMYLKMCPMNIFETEPDYFYSLIFIGIIFAECLILYLQSKLGGLFFIPKIYRPGFYDYYKTIQQIKIFRTDIESCQCAICLIPFVESDIIDQLEPPKSSGQISTSNTSDFSAQINQTASSDLLLNTLDVRIKSQDDVQKVKINCREKFKGYFKHNDKQENAKIQDTKLMVTPCNHIFHPECLKIWGERKNECPVCRKEIPCMEE